MDSDAGLTTDPPLVADPAAVGLREGLRGDVAANLGSPAGDGGALTLLVRLLTNPQIRACALVRLAASAPRSCRWLWRNLLISLHSIDVQPGAIIAPGLRLPHPFGIAIGSTTRIGSNVSIGHHVTLTLRTPEGELSPLPTVIEDGVKIFTNTTISGGVRVGTGAVIGSHALVTEDVPPGGVVMAHSKQ